MYTTYLDQDLDPDPNPDPDPDPLYAYAGQPISRQKRMMYGYCHDNSMNNDYKPGQGVVVLETNSNVAISNNPNTPLDVDQDLDQVPH